MIHKGMQRLHILECIKNRTMMFSRGGKKKNMVLILLHKSQLSLLNYSFSINELLLATKGTWERANWGKKKKKQTN